MRTFCIRAALLGAALVAGCETMQNPYATGTPEHAQWQTDRQIESLTLRQGRLERQQQQMQRQQRMDQQRQIMRDHFGHRY